MQCATFLPLRLTNMPLECKQQLPGPCTKKFFLVCRRTGNTMQHVVGQTCKHSQGPAFSPTFCGWRDNFMQHATHDAATSCVSSRHSGQPDLSPERKFLQAG